MRRWTAGAWALRTSMAAGILLALVATALVGPAPAPWLVVVVAALAVVFARFPESHAGAVAMGVVVVWWGVSLRDSLQPQILIAAAGLLSSHVAGVVSAYGPDDLPVDPATLRRWLWRGAAAFLLAPVLWLAGLVVRDGPEPAGVWVAGLAVALLGTLALTTAFQVRGSDR